MIPACIHCTWNQVPNRNAYWNDPALSTWAFFLTMQRVYNVNYILKNLYTSSNLERSIILLFQIIKNATCSCSQRLLF